MQDKTVLVRSIKITETGDGTKLLVLMTPILSGEDGETKGLKDKQQTGI